MRRAAKPARILAGARWARRAGTAGGAGRAPPAAAPPVSPRQPLSSAAHGTARHARAAGRACDLHPWLHTRGRAWRCASRVVSTGRTRLQSTAFHKDRESPLINEENVGSSAFLPDSPRASRTPIVANSCTSHARNAQKVEFWGFPLRPPAFCGCLLPKRLGRGDLPLSLVVLTGRSVGTAARRAAGLGGLRWAWRPGLGLDGGPCIACSEERLHPARRQPPASHMSPFMPRPPALQSPGAAYQSGHTMAGMIRKKIGAWSGRGR